jgi:hypothetical protein
MAVSEMELNEALTRAASLMSPEGQRRIEASSRANKGNFSGEGDYIQPAASHGMRGTRPQAAKTPASNSSSKLPRAILESMSNNPIDAPASEYNAGSSILDTLGYTPPPAPKRQPVNETYMYEQQYTAPQPQYYPPQQPQYVPQPQMMGIDYNYIKAIVNECIQANMQQIKEELLKESALKMVRLSGGNKIQLIDNKNNLYESQLEFKKNISKK